MDFNCGALREENVGGDAVLYGWCRYIRDHGGKLFIDLADRYGCTQLVFEGEVGRKAGDIGKEFVIRAEGKVRKREEDTFDKANPTGSIEIFVSAFEILGKSEVPPFELIEEKRKFLANDEMRLKHRYLDLRRQEMVRRVLFRDKLTKEIRSFFWENDFLELETPMLVKDTYETGSRTFLVPSRTMPGKFYSLPQSPQMYKQLCIIAGLDRYFQIARCFRDEDPREDRQPEFMQIDVEIAFKDEAYIEGLIEGMLVRIFRNVLGKEIEGKFAHMDYSYAMENYGSDKPDLRFENRIVDITEDAEKSDYNILRRVVEAKGRVKALCFNAGYGSGVQKMDKNYMLGMIAHAKALGLKGLTWLYVKGGEIASEPQSIADSLGNARSGILKKTGAGEGDIIVVCADTSERLLLEVMGKIRKAMGERIGVYAKEYAMLWVENFPLFDKDEVTGRLKPAHNPFSAPTAESVRFLDSEPEKVISRQYDLVINGVEAGGGSIRINDPETQRRVLEAIGMRKESIDRSFGFLIEALGYGAPPEGGIALGLDRLAAILYGEENIREFILFPKNKRFESPIDESPTPIDGKRLKDDYGISLG